MERKILVVMFVLLNGVMFAAESKFDVVEKMGLRETFVEGATVYYEPCFEAKLGVFKKEYQIYKKLVSKENIQRFKAKKEAIYKDMESIVGSHEQLRGTYDSTFAAMLEVSEGVQGWFVREPTFFLVGKETTKNYLRKGGTLPNFTYDKETDTAKCRFEYVQKKGQEEEATELSIPLTCGEEFDGEIRAAFKMFTELQTTISLDFIIHEVAEMCLAVRLRSMAPYLRWFRDGFAEAVTYEILRKHFGQEAAKKFLQGKATDKLETSENQVNLQYWMLLRYTVGNDVPIEKEGDLTIARYRYSFHEAKRLVNGHGIGCLKRIIDEFRKTEIKDAGALYRAIQKVTGEDLLERFKRYQDFNSKEDGLRFYVNHFKQAQAKNSMEDMLYNALRSFELYINPTHPRSWETRKTISILLYRMGHEELADEAMNNFVSYVDELNIKEATVDAKRNFIIYAIETQRPELGYDYATEVLKKDPKEFVSLTVVMLKYAKENNLEEAKKVAKEICEIVPDENTGFNRMAKQILAK